MLVDGARARCISTSTCSDLDVDFYVFTGHKVYGPTGIGVLYGKREWLDAMPPYQGGGEMIREVRHDRITYDDPPHRFEAGTPPIVEAVGLGAALRFMMDARPRQHPGPRGGAVATMRMSGWAPSIRLRIIGRRQGKGAIVAFEMEGAHAHDVATIIDRQGVAVRAGTHCAMPLLERFGVTSTCRASVRPLQHAGQRSISWPRRCARPKPCSREDVDHGHLATPPKPWRPTPRRWRRAPRSRRRSSTG